MSRNWTSAQTAAMETQGRTLLISAAAGSGKTATLTERIIRRLTDPEHPAELSRLLIVTFTRAAAAELKERIAGALSEAIRRDPGNRHLQRQLLGLSSAYISTIDAFVREPVKANFAELGLPAATRIADEAELAPLRERVMGDLMEEFYHTYATEPTGELFSLLAGNAFADLCDSLTPSKNDEALMPTFLSLYERLLSFPAALERLRAEADALDAQADGDFFASDHGVLLREWLSDFCVSAQETLSAALNDIRADEAAAKAYDKAFSSDLAFVQRLASAAGYAEAHALLATYKNERLGALRGASEKMAAHKEARADLVKAIKAMGKDYFTDTPGAVARQMRETAVMCRVLYDFLTAYDRRILAEKQARGISDFTDNRRYLLRLLREANGNPTALAIDFAAQFDEVYIDEYQDVDEMQDEIFRIVGGNHRFMVGDIKQSIYGFRGADPSVFARYRRELTPLTPGASESQSPNGNSIFMSENFRCDESIIRVTNAVCGHILRACPASVGYGTSDDLGFAKALPTVDYKSPRVEVTVLTKPPKEDGETAEMAETARPADSDGDSSTGAMVEAMYVANEIARLLRSGTSLANGEPIRPKDIVILMRATTSLATYREALTAMGIPTGSDELDAREAGRDILHGSDMMYWVNLLRVIDNPDADIPLSEILRAPFPGLSLEEVLSVRRAERSEVEGYSLYECLETYAASEDAEPATVRKVVDFMAWIEHYRALCETQPADGLLRLLARDDKCACRATDAYRYLYESARTCQTSTFVSLYSFLRYFEKKLLTTKNASLTAGAEDEWGHVSLMTIHKSKGLEFPVCFVVRCGQAFSRQSMTQDLIFEKRTGVSMKLYRREAHVSAEACMGGELPAVDRVPREQVKVDTTLRAVGALAIKLTEREEEMRVLYVAMTRARERLYIVGQGTEQAIHLREGDRFATLSCSSYLSWVLAGLDAHPEVEEFCRVQFVSTADVHRGEKLIITRAASTTGGELNDTAARYRRILTEYSQPTEQEIWLSRVPTKVPASRMNPRLLDECVFYDTDLPADDGGKLPDGDLVAGGTYCDAQTLAAIRESLRLMSRAEGDVNEFELLLGENRRPTASERGTAAHLFLQYCDYERVLSHGLEEEIARLFERGFLNARTVQILDRTMISAFFESSFFAHVREAMHVERELKFHRFVPLAELTSRAELSTALGNRTLYVQGSIDLFCEFPDGHIELCDYKTDHIYPEERDNPALLVARMTERHGEQLRQYAAAIGEMYGKRPTKVYVYSLPLGEALEIPI